MPSLACADGLRVFPIFPNRAQLYREDIASRLQCPSRLLQLVPARPGPRDVAFFGLHSRTVIATPDRSTVRPDERSTVGLLDARRVYKGWLPLVTTDCWLDVASVLGHVATDFPLGWHACINDIEPGQSHVYLEDGLVLTVIARQNQEGHSATADTSPSEEISSSTDSGG